MPLRATDNPLVLPLLGLLLEQPRHPYALLTELRSRYRHLRVRTGSVYTLVGSLQEAGWIEPTDRKSEHAEKSRTDFRLTPAGVAEFRNRVANDLEDADPANAMNFLTALAYIGILDRSDAAATLNRRVNVLRQRADELEQALRAAATAPAYMTEVAYAESQTRHEITWLENFIGQVTDPDYEWPIDTPEDHEHEAE